MPRDRNCTPEEIELLQNQVTLFCQLCNATERGLIERYLDQTRTQADGTLDAIMPHVFNLTEMQNGKRNMKCLRSVLQHIIAIRDLADEQVKQEVA